MWRNWVWYGHVCWWSPPSSLWLLLCLLEWVTLQTSFYTSDASNTNWHYIGSITPPDDEDKELKISGSYNYRDNPVFAVKLPANRPTWSPVTPSPSEPGGGDSQQASYDYAWTSLGCSKMYFIWIQMYLKDWSTLHAVSLSCVRQLWLLINNLWFIRINSPLSKP